MRGPIAPTPAYRAWVEATQGPDLATPEVEPGERATRTQRGWWDVVSKEGNRYELTCRPTLSGPVWSVRYRSSDGFETVATTGMADTVLTGMRAHSAERDHQPADEGRPNRYMYRLPADRPVLLAPALVGPGGAAARRSAPGQWAAVYGRTGAADW
jgi:hypothetical protein